MTNDKLTVIGRTESARFPGDSDIEVPVKIDTGADRSSIWASNIFIDEEHLLHYTLFDSDSPYYSSQIHKTKKYSVVLVRSSNGKAQIRYRVDLSITMAGREIIGSFTLADRSKNRYPVLIGCKLLKNKFVVDVSRFSKVEPPLKDDPELNLNEEFKNDPKAFFDKYHLNNSRGDTKL